MTETYLGGNLTAEFDGVFLQLTQAQLESAEDGLTGRPWNDGITMSVPQWEELKRFMAAELLRKDPRRIVNSLQV